MAVRRELVMATLVLAVSAVACEDGVVLDVGGRDVNGSGTIVTETRDVSGFDRITLAGEGTLIVTEGQPESLTIETDDNLMDHIETAVSNNTLEIATESGIDIDPTESVTYRVTTPDLIGLTLTGAGTMEAAEVEAADFAVTLTGAGEIIIGALTADELDVSLTGVGEVRVAGTVRSQNVQLPGAGSYDGGELASVVADVDAIGAGSATVWVTDELDVMITGVGSVDYYGNPSVNQVVTGVGSVSSLGEK